jgi:hypothetical protein
MKSLLLAIELAPDKYSCGSQGIPTPITSILAFRLWFRGIVCVDWGRGYLLFADRRVKWWQVPDEEVLEMRFHRRIKEDVVIQILDKGVGVTVEDIAYSVVFGKGDITLSPYQFYVRHRTYGVFYFVFAIIFSICAAVILK